MTSNINVTIKGGVSTASTAVNSVNGYNGNVVLDTDDILDTSSVNKYTTGGDITKLAGIEANADVTDATNVDAAGAVMNTDTSTVSMSFVLDEDTLVSDSNTALATQQSIKAYVDSGLSTKTSAANVVVSNDGTGDYNCDGTDDYVEIQAAIDAVNAAGGGVVEFKNTGTNYVKGTTDIVMKSNVWIDFNGAILENGTGGSLFESVADLDNIRLKNLNIAATSSPSYIINLGGDNTNTAFDEVVFEETDGRALYCGGSFWANRVNCKNSWAGIGTKDYKLDAAVDPLIMITNCELKNLNKTVGTEGEGIEINCHNVGKLIIDNVNCEGFTEELFDLNIGEIQGGNLRGVAYSSSTGAGVTVNASEVNVRGSLTNINISNIGTSMTGVAVNQVDGFVFNNVVLKGTTPTSPVGRGFYHYGSSSTFCTVNNIHCEDLATGISSSTNELFGYNNYSYNNVTATTDNGSGGNIEPLFGLSTETYRNVSDSPHTWMDGMHVSVGANEFILARNTPDLTDLVGSPQEHFGIGITDTDINFSLWNPDDTTTQTHDWNFNINSDATGNHNFTVYKADADGSTSKYALGGFENTTAVSDNATLRIGNNFLWVDSTGALRVKTSRPSSDTDGSLV